MNTVNIDEALKRAVVGEVSLVSSAWFNDPHDDELQVVYAEIEHEYAQLLPQFVSRLGPPDFTEATAPEIKNELYCEAIRLSGWKHGKGFLLLAFGQHDKETPVFVSIGLRMP